jgi:putative MATE family efflux protein
LKSSDSPRRALLRLAGPASLAIFVHQLFRLNDQFFAEELGISAQAAVGVGGMVAIVMLACGEMVGIGTLAIASRRLGEGNVEAGHQTIRKGLRVGMVTGLLVGGIVLVLLPWLCEQLVPGADHATEREQLNRYLTCIAAGQVVIVTSQVIDQAFLALRDSRTPMLLQILAVSTNAGLNALLVQYYGVLGIGVATVLSRLLAVALGLFLLARAGTGSFLRDTSRGAPASRILRIGLPTGLAIATYSLVYQVLIALTIEEFGPAARTTIGIGFGIETVFYCAYWGVAVAQASLVGHYLGEGSVARTLQVTGFTARLNLLIGVVCSLCFVLFGPHMVSLFSEDPAVLAANLEYLELMAIAQPFQAVHEAFSHALIGAGNTLPVMVNTMTMNVIRVPAAHLLGVVAGYGMTGVWWAINLSTFGKFAWSAVLYRRRKWLETRV